MFGNTEEFGGGQVLLHRGDGVALIEMNRPERLNALTMASLDALVAALTAVSEDAGLHALVLTGRGKAFCAGIDLKELAEDNRLMNEGNLGPQTKVMRALADCPVPIIGAINGAAVTGGFEIALACDFLYAADTARFADTHARVGLIPGWGLSQKLPRLVGINRARELSFTGNFFSAADAQAWGLVNAVFPADALLEAALATAHQIADTEPEALRRIKRMMNDGWEGSLGEGLAMEGELATRYNSAIDVSAMDERLAKLQRRARG